MEISQFLYTQLRKGVSNFSESVYVPANEKSRCPILRPPSPFHTSKVLFSCLRARGTRSASITNILFRKPHQLDCRVSTRSWQAHISSAAAINGADTSGTAVRVCIAICQASACLFVSTEAGSVGSRVALTIVGAAGTAVDETTTNLALTSRGGADAIRAGTTAWTYVPASAAVVVVG